MKTYLKDLTPEEVVKRLQNHERAKSKEGHELFMINSVLCEKVYNDKVNINVSIFNHENKYYFETPDELKLEVGKCYKTRDGRKAFISDYNSATKYFRGAVVEFLDLVIWTNDGMYLYTTAESGLDLISEWSDDDVEKD